MADRMTRAYDPAKRRARNLRRYDIDERQFTLMWERQNGHCDICGKPLRPNAHVDHSHRDQRVRGLLCWPCNRLIGRYHDPLIFRNAARYLESTFDGRTL
jgi:hypothetical protein